MSPNVKGVKIMVQKTESSTAIQEVTVASRSDGAADVWLHKNIEQTTSADEDGNETTAYTADEVHFQYTYSDTLESELTESFDKWWEYGETWEPSAKLTDAERIAALETENAMLTEAILELSEAVYA